MIGTIHLIIAMPSHPVTLMNANSRKPASPAEIFWIFRGQSRIAGSLIFVATPRVKTRAWSLDIWLW
jgi:hypothetical protein